MVTTLKISSHIPSTSPHVATTYIMHTLMSVLTDGMLLLYHKQHSRVTPNVKLTIDSFPE